MTVRELIEKLQAFEPDVVVGFRRWNGYVEEAEIAEVDEVRGRHPHDPGPTLHGPVCDVILEHGDE